MGLPKINLETKQVAVQRFELILKRATEKKASDIHLKVGLPPILRVNGQLYYLDDGGTAAIPTRLSATDVTEIAYALMHPRQVEKYESGAEVDLAYEISGMGRFRVNLCQQRSNPRLVVRHIPDIIRSVKDLQLPPVVEDLAGSQRGLIIITGTTGSGKSTTIAAIIDCITRTRSCHIVTIEDPIEFVFKDRKSVVTQREVGLDTPNFVQALKYALRQDPDVILVGEMRDEETILMALAAAETGHLVLSTLHTMDAVETINRIVGSVGIGMQTQARMQLAAVMTGVVSQRLLKRKDGKSRIAAVEILLPNARVREMISDPARTTDLRKVIDNSHSTGMQSFDQSLMWLYKKDLISREDAIQHCTNPQDFQLRLQGVVPGQWRENEETPSVNIKTQLTRTHLPRGSAKNMDSESIELEEGLFDPATKRRR